MTTHDEGAEGLAELYAGADRAAGWELEPNPHRIIGEPSTRRVTLSLRHRDASVSAVSIEWPADVRLPVAGDAIRIPDVGTVIINGATFDTATELDGGARRWLRSIELGCYVIAGT
jgi:hypothetical protein